MNSEFKKKYPDFKMSNPDLRKGALFFILVILLVFCIYCIYSFV